MFFQRTEGWVDSRDKQAFWIGEKRYEF